MMLRWKPGPEGVERIEALRRLCRDPRALDENAMTRLREIWTSLDGQEDQTRGFLVEYRRMTSAVRSTQAGPDDPRLIINPADHTVRLDVGDRSVRLTCDFQGATLGVVGDEPYDPRQPAQAAFIVLTGVCSAAELLPMPEGAFDPTDIGRQEIIRVLGEADGEAEIEFYWPDWDALAAELQLLQALEQRRVLAHRGYAGRQLERR